LPRLSSECGRRQKQHPDSNKKSLFLHCSLQFQRFPPEWGTVTHCRSDALDLDQLRKRYAVIVVGHESSHRRNP
jgi:hypothetical protein